MFCFRVMPIIPSQSVITLISRRLWHQNSKHIDTEEWLLSSTAPSSAYLCINNNENLNPQRIVTIVANNCPPRLVPVPHKGSASSDVTSSSRSNLLCAVVYANRGCPFHQLNERVGDTLLILTDTVLLLQCLKLPNATRFLSFFNTHFIISAKHK